jgi:hypothetical protein
MHRSLPAPAVSMRRGVYTEQGKRWWPLDSNLDVDASSDKSSRVEWVRMRLTLALAVAAAAVSEATLMLEKGPLHARQRSDHDHLLPLRRGEAKTDPGSTIPASPAPVVLVLEPPGPR